MFRFTRAVGFTFLVLSGWLMGVTAGADSIGVYWGQNSNEGSLKEACDSGSYSAVIIAYLTNFGGGRNPRLNISSHCDLKSGNCTDVANDIRDCQWQNVNILLSIGGAAGGYSIDSAADVSNVSSYLWNTFLGGTSLFRPFGNVTLDGIDFDVDYTPGDSEHYADLALSLRNHSRGPRLLYLSASVRCQITQSKLRTLLNRYSLAYTWVHFYNNPACEYNSSSAVYPDGSSLRFVNLMSSWSQWTSRNNSGTVFLKLPASADAAKSGFIPPADLFVFLSIIRTSRNYGGLMLWSRYYDSQTQYASKLLNFTAPAGAPTPLPALPPSTPLAPGSLNPDAPLKPASRVSVIAGATAAAVVTLLVLIAVSSFFFGKNHVIMVRKRLNCLYAFRKSRRYRPDEDYVDQLVPGLLTRFRYQTLVDATENFSEKLGEGGYGSVFAGTLRDGTEIAVKCLDGIGPVKKSFLAEVETIGSIHHINLVRLVGYCSEKSRAILVYEYLPKGSLDKWIFHNDPELSLDWETRKKIISGVAKGLVYLHEECRQKIAHLDIKPQNILLTESFDAKVGDFGLSKLIDRGENLVVSTMRGTIGYLAPDWLGSVITEKVDV
uniref:non-specific serine/threonine protein kinase n=1 Tax=Kalanchoe fedtschenkoi TaxID=63787 RepID=A0A7N0V337_KALFE